MVSLVLEGGTFRPIFSAGVMDALLDNNIIFPYCIGVSAGITNGFSYFSNQKGRNIEILKKYRNDKRYLSLSNFFKCRSIFGLDFVFDELANKLFPYDFNALSNYKGRVLVGVTNANTGKTEYLDGKVKDEKYMALRATCAIPILFPAIKINGNEYYDGGLLDPIPIKKAIADGNEKHLIILTRPKSYRKTLGKSNKLASKIVGRKYPNLKGTFLSRHIKYNETVKFCEELERAGKAIIIRPNEDEAIESFEKDVTKLEEAYNYGYNACIKNLEKIKALF
ncbi:patatin family protein [Clostridium perfringens]|uniref:patatin-like phospholipase family protein n=1 Tax=Clostridium perfringens TaxID=1502 RepID=UPI000F51C32E|nr:patatin family protein [Clostridium perfringens]MDU7724764.1 patatin family protein [Clostridium perfringens]HAT4117906.1 patatin family protein [Clostridium perfringens]